MSEFNLTGTLFFSQEYWVYIHRLEDKFDRLSLQKYCSDELVSWHLKIHHGISICFNLSLEVCWFEWRHRFCDIGRRPNFYPGYMQDII